MSPQSSSSLPVLVHSSDSTHDSINLLLTEVVLEKQKVQSSHRTRLLSFKEEFLQSLSDHRLKCCIEVASERGSSSWLTALPLTTHGFIRGNFVTPSALDTAGLLHFYHPTGIIYLLCGGSVPSN